MCDNKVSYFIPSGYDVREVFTPCGYTDVYGERAICDECASDKRKMRDIRQHEANIRADNWAARSAGYGEF